MSKSKPTLEGAKPLGRCELVIILYCTVITRIPKSLLSSMLDLSIRLCHGKTMMRETSSVFYPEVMFSSQVANAQYSTLCH